MTEQLAGPQGIHHVAMSVRDFDASLAFYQQGVGLTPCLTWGEGNARAVMLDTGNGSCLELFAGGPATPRPEGVYLHLALRVADPDAAYARALAAGATAMKPPFDFLIDSQPQPTPVRIAFCTGPDGEVLEFFRSAGI